MKNYILISVLLLSPINIFSQGFGFGFEFAQGWKSNFKVGEGYDQSISSSQYNHYVRWFSDNGRRAHQMIWGFRYDSIGFKNYSTYYNATSNSVENFDVNATLKRYAFRTGYKEQFHIIGKPGRFVLAGNLGIFYEGTIHMNRSSYYDDYEYTLYNEQNRHNIIFSAGLEARVWWFTVGYKWEHMFFDMIDHDHINAQSIYPGNSSELNGLKLSPSMGFIYFVVNFDFFSDSEN